MPTRTYFEQDGAHVEVDLTKIVYEDVCDYCGAVAAPQVSVHGTIVATTGAGLAVSRSFIAHPGHELQAALAVLATVAKSDLTCIQR